MANNDVLNFQLPEANTNQFIIERLIEIEVRQIFMESNIRIILGRIREKEDNYNYEQFINDCENELRRIRLDLAASFIQKYS